MTFVYFQVVQQVMNIWSVLIMSHSSLCENIRHPHIHYGHLCCDTPAVDIIAESFILKWLYFNLYYRQRNQVTQVNYPLLRTWSVNKMSNLKSLRNLRLQVCFVGVYLLVLSNNGLYAFINHRSENNFSSFVHTVFIKWKDIHRNQACGYICISEIEFLSIRDI